MMTSIFALLLTVALFALQVLDTYTTTRIDDSDGVKNNNEQNKAMRWLFNRFGRNTVLNAKTIVVTVIGWWLGSTRFIVGDVLLDGFWIELALVGWYAYIVFGYNWKSMPKDGA